METWDLIVIGGGAAGLSAGIYGVRSGLKTLVLDDKIAGGTTNDAPRVENYPGFSEIGGMELAKKMVDHAVKAGVKIGEFESVLNLDLKNDTKKIKTAKTEYETKTVIFATGSHYRQLGVPGENEFRGRGVSYCGICDGPLFKGKNVLVVGGGNSALITTLYLSDLVSHVAVAHRRDRFRAEEAYVKDLETKNVEVLLNTEIKEIRGEKLVTTAVVFNNRTEQTREINIDGIFVQIGEDPNSRLAKDAGIDVDECGYVKTDFLQHTNVPGVYAAGDVTSHPVKQIGTAVGQGITAALEAYSFIRRPYYKR